MKRRKLLAALLAVGGGSAAWHYRNMADGEHSETGQNRVKEIDISPPDNELIDQYRSRTQSVINAQAEPNQQLVFADREVVVALSTEGSVENQLIRQAEARPADSGNGDILVLQPGPRGERPVTILTNLTRAVIGIGHTVQFSATVSGIELPFRGSEIPGNDGFAVTAADTSREQVILLRGESADGVRTIAEELSQR